MKGRYFTGQIRSISCENNIFNSENHINLDFLCVLADYGAKPKGFAAKLKKKFRRHKSSENLRPESPGELYLFL